MKLVATLAFTGLVGLGTIGTAEAMTLAPMAVQVGPGVERAAVVVTTRRIVRRPIVHRRIVIRRIIR